MLVALVGVSGPVMVLSVRVSAELLLVMVVLGRTGGGMLDGNRIITWGWRAAAVW